MKALVAALNRVAAALEALVPALTQATRETSRPQPKKPNPLSDYYYPPELPTKKARK